MRQLFTFLLIALAMQVAQAQNTAAHKLFDKYEDEEGFTSVLISEFAFQMLSNVNKGGEKDFEEVGDMITGIRILTAENSSKAANFYRDLQQTFQMKSAQYKPLMTVKDDGEEVLFYLKEENKKIKEFILLVQNPTNPVMILIEGEDIDLNKLKRLSGKTDMGPLDQLNQISN